MDKACKNCRFCIYAHSRGKDEPYCERHNKWIGKTILCSEWDAVIVPKPITNADRIRAMSDEELADLYMKAIEDEEYPGWWGNRMGLLAWLKAEATW